MCKRVIIPLPSYGFDPTEAAIPWLLLSEAGFNVTFATPQGRQGKADAKMLTGKSLGIWKPILQARQDARTAYFEMEKSAAFLEPVRYDDVNEKDFNGILLPGGHDKGVKEYLESNVLQRVVADFFQRNKPVAAICHGVVLAARSIDPSTGRSVLYNRKTTSLLRSQEMAAYRITQLWLGDYYLTYPGMTVQDEVTGALADAKNYLTGPSPMLRDDKEHLQRGFTVRDGLYLSARWPGDAYNFSMEFIKMLREYD